MPHVALIPLTGFRLREAELLAYGMTLPGLSARGQAIGELPALGLLTLAGLLDERWTCSYLPATTADEALAERVAAERPTFAALSALTASVEEAYHFSGLLRARGIPVVLGGLHATACPEEALQFCDSVAVGPGEHVWRRILADAEHGALQPIYRAIARGNDSQWPLPRFDLLGKEPPRWTLQTQQGCPLACDFCGASRLLGSFREKPVGQIELELAAIRALDARPVLELADDNTFAGSRDPFPLLDALAAAGARWFTESDWRIGERPALLQRLAAAGCVQVLVGIESLVFRYPGMGPKHEELRRIMAAVENIQAAGVAVNGCFIVGADGEDERSLERLAAFLADCPLADVQLTLQTPFPGTTLYRRLREAGRLLSDRSWSHYTLFDVTYVPDRLSVRALEQGFYKLLGATFGLAQTQRRAAIRRRVWRNNPCLNRGSRSHPSGEPHPNAQYLLDSGS